MNSNGNTIGSAPRCPCLKDFIVGFLCHELDPFWGDFFFLLSQLVYHLLTPPLEGDVLLQDQFCNLCTDMAGVNVSALFSALMGSDMCWVPPWFVACDFIQVRTGGTCENRSCLHVQVSEQGEHSRWHTWVGCGLSAGVNTLLISLTPLCCWWLI